MWITTDLVETGIIILIAAVSLIQVQFHQKVFWLLENVLWKKNRYKILLRLSFGRSLYTTMLSFFFKKCVLFLAVAKSEGGLPCPERTLATNSF